MTDKYLQALGLYDDPLGTFEIASDDEVLREIHRDLQRRSAQPLWRRQQDTFWGEDGWDTTYKPLKDSNRDWRGKRVNVEHLANAYESIDQRKADRLRVCGDRLVFGVDAEGTMRLRNAQFCRVRLCPMCQWRRSLKLYSQMTKIIEHLSDCDYRYIMLTLTIQNIKLDKLPVALDEMMCGVRRLFQYDEVKGISKGWYRGTEVTHNLDPSSLWYNTFHPHFHMVIAVNKSYFSSRNYLSQSRWGELWAQALGTDYIPRVDIRAIKGKDGKTLEDGKITANSICEVTKYAAKSKDYIILDDWDLTLETIAGLDAALTSRRLIGFGGVMRKARADLKMDDIENGDLVEVNPDEKTAIDVYQTCYAWHVGFSQYVRRNEGH